MGRGSITAPTLTAGSLVAPAGVLPRLDDLLTFRLPKPPSLW